MTMLVPRDLRERDALDALRSRAQALESECRARDAEVSRLRGELDVFRAWYRLQVGTLYEQLDELEHQIAEAELGELAAQLDEARGDESTGGGGAAGGGTGATAGQSPRFTSDAVRKLFRDVAKAIHPDLAGDAAARDRRHALMIEANRAYANGDEARLRLILESWERSPEAVQGSDAVAVRQRLERRIDELERDLETMTSELAELKSSPLWELKSKVDEANAKGRDLVGEMMRRLQRDIMVATNRLNAIRG